MINIKYLVKKCVALMVALILLSACSSSNTPVLQHKVSAQSNTEYSKQMADFERMQPSLERLVVLESELKELISQLNEIASQAEDAEQTSSTVSPTVITPPDLADNEFIQAEEPSHAAVLAIATQPATEISEASPQPANVTAMPTPTVRGPYTLQLFAVTDKQKVLSSWLHIQQQQKQLLGDLVAISQEINISGVTFYRIKVGFYSTEKEANKNCIALQKAGANCVVSDNSGKEII